MRTDQNKEPKMCVFEPLPIRWRWFVYPYLYQTKDIGILLNFTETEKVYPISVHISKNDGFWGKISLFGWFYGIWGKNYSWQVLWNAQQVETCPLYQHASSQDFFGKFLTTHISYSHDLVLSEYFLYFSNFFITKRLLFVVNILYNKNIFTQ